MKICNKCKIEKEDNCFYTYFHKVQQKFRTRSICTECEYARSREYKKKVRKKEIVPTIRIFKSKIIPIELQEPIPDITLNPNFKLCRSCKEYLPLEHFYPAQRNMSASCKECAYEEYVKRKLEKNKQGYDCDTKKPNTYTSEEQKIEVFMIMEIMGWTYNDNGVWSKPGIKDKNNKWDNINKKYLNKRKNPRHSQKNLKSIYKDKILPEVKLKFKHFDSPSDETINQIVYDFFKTDASKKDISKKYNVSVDRINTYIYKILKHNENE